jgi:hypothetical protein
LPAWVVIVRRSLSDPLSQARYWASSDLCASAQGLVEHISARWDIEVLKADGKEEFGLDQYQLMSAAALVRALRVWLCLPTPFSMKNGTACRSNGNALSPLAKRVGRSNVFIDASFSSGFASSSSRGPLTSLCLNSSPLNERSFGKVQS